MASFKERGKVRPVFHVVRGTDKKESARKLQQWAVGEMQLNRSTKSIPSETDYQRICSGSLSNIWEFVLQHVKSAEKIKKIHGNLNRHVRTSGHHELSGSSETIQSSKRSMFKKRKQHILTELDTLGSQISFVENAMTRLQKIVTNSEEECFLTAEESDKCCHNQQFIKEFCCVNEKIAGKYFKIIDALKEILQRNLSPSQQKKIPVYLHLYSLENTWLETACMRDVHKSTEAIQKFLFDSSKGNYISDRSLQLNRRKELCRQIMSIFMGSYVDDVYKCLSELHNKKTVMLKTKLYARKQQANAKIALNYTKNKSPTKQMPVFTTAVNDISKEAKLAIIEEFMNMLHDETKIAELEMLKAKMLEQINNRLDELFLSQMEQIEIARKFLQSEESLVTIGTSYSALESVKSVLESKIGSHIKNDMILKYKTILKCQDILYERMKILRVLKARMVGLGINGKVQRNLALIRNTIGNRPAECVKELRNLEDCVSRELTTFSRLPNTLTTVLLDTKLALAPFLSVAVHGQFTTFNKMLSDAFGQILIQAPENILRVVVHLKKTETHFKGIRECQNMTLKQMMYEYDESGAMVINCRTETRLRDLLSEIQDKRQHQFALIPKCSKCITEMEIGFKECEKLDQLISDWWKQPVENIALPLTVNGMNFIKWKERMVIESKLGT